MDEHSTQETVEASATAQHKDVGLMNPDVTMLILTWITFFLLLAVLQKFAWKPIVTALENRENYLRKSLENADKINAELADVQSSKEKILADAQRAGQEIIDQARKRAQDVARSVEERAKEQAAQLVSAAHQEIEGERERLKAALRRQSADIAVGLAGKLLKENLDNEKNRKIVDQYIKEV
jgi:F-type H+-transporting ATPase subunit b